MTAETANLIASVLFLVCFVWMLLFPPWVCRDLWGDWRPIGIIKRFQSELEEKKRMEEEA